MTTPEGSEPSFADVLNNLSLDSGRSRRRWRRDQEEPTDPRPDPAVAIQPGPTAPVADPAALGGTEPVTLEQPAVPAEAADEWADVGWDPEGAQAAGVTVRPYAWTRGRTRPVYDLAVEALVSTSDHGRDVAALTSVEHRSVAELCREPRSVAEVAALLSLPLGVARVVLGDMADIGLVAVHRTASTGDVPDIALMERVLSGLRAL